MEVEDVIELGSSDDEAEPPAPKKIKPFPNAMVHIPNKIRDVTINPVSSNKSKLSRKLVPRVPNQIPIVTMSHTNINARQSKPNGRCLQKITPQTSSQRIKTDKAIPISHRLNSNMLKILPRKPLKVGNWNSGIQKPRVQGISPKIISRLPPSITVTKTCGGSSTQLTGVVKNKIRVNKALANNKFGEAKNKTYPVSCLGDILTVELDDDENTSSVDKSSPAQWYLRPEELVEKNKLEEQNNSEPKGIEMIEITIEDSPVKPCLIERAKTVNDTLSITIEDSPVKVINKPTTEPDLGSDTNKDRPKSPQSKKKLDYPQTENINEVFIEIDSDNVIQNDAKEVTNKNEVTLSTPTNEEKSKTSIEKQDTTADPEQLNDTTQKDFSPKKDNLIENSNEVEKNTSSDKDMDVSNESSGEFHSTFQRFMDLCLEIDKTEDMKTIVEKRIKTYSRQVPKEFVESEQFIDMVSTKIILIKSEPSKIYLHIKDIVDELKLQRKRKKETPLENENIAVEGVEIDTNKYDRKRRIQIRKLEKTLKTLERSIKKFDEQEVDFDDEEDSVYLLNDRYKERFVHIYAKLCQLTDTKMLTEPRITIECRAGQPPGPARKLEKWVNKKVPIGSTLPFPDFHDVIKCVREANAEDKLGWNEADIIEEARDLFTRCGKKLQRRRQENEWRLAVSRITQHPDPAEGDEVLKNKLNENKTKAAKKETELLNKYAQKQNQLSLEPTEIDDKEADNSPVESDDEVEDNSDLLEDSQKRKDRLRRLIDEKESKKKPINNIEQHTSLGSNKESYSICLPNESKENETETIELKDQDIIEIEKNKQIEEKMDTETDHELENSADISNVNNIECEKDVIKDTSIEIVDDSYKEQILSENVKEIVIDECEKEIEVSPKTDVNLKSDQNDANVYLICDDFYGDELNLLEKLNSGNETSSPDSSDLDDTTIAISDSADSSSESEQYESYDVISIGNSSSSETEKTTSVKNKDTAEKNNDTVKSVNAVSCNLETETQNNQDIEARTARTNSINDLTPSDNESENILLAYSEDEVYSEYVNLKNNSLMIDETIVVKNTDRDEESNKSDGDLVFKDDKIISASKTIDIYKIDSDEVEDGKNKEVDLKNYDNIIKDKDDTIANNENQNYTENDESLVASKKIIQESESESTVCSDINNEYMICDNNGVETSDSVHEKQDATTNDNSNDPTILDQSLISTESSGDLEPIVSKTKIETTSQVTSKSESLEESIEPKETSDQLIIMETDQEACGDPITLDINQKLDILDKSGETEFLEESRESILDASQVSKTKEISDQLLTMETDQESQLSASGDPINLDIHQKLDILDKSGETEFLEESRESILDASQVSKTKEISDQLLTMETDQESQLSASGDPINLEVNPESETPDNSCESELLGENCEINSLEETGERTTLEASREIMTLDENSENLFLEDSTEVETHKESEEPNHLEGCLESKTLEASGETAYQSVSGDEMMAMSEEPIIFDEDVEPVTVEVGEGPKSVEDNTEAMSPEQAEPSTSVVDNNVSSSNERDSPSTQESLALERTFNMVEMMLDNLFNPVT